MTTACQEYIAKAACQKMLDDIGYPVPLAHTCLPFWYGGVDSAISRGKNADPVSPLTVGQAIYLDTIEEKHPGYAIDLYMYAETGHWCTCNMAGIGRRHESEVACPWRGTNRSF